ncbi:MAG: FAD-dependent oxidoreductase [Alphaproteobacteria bacterium]|nr:FAD-dependent oxidoreductase [Alphaproteobacteria bacterium]
MGDTQNAPLKADICVIGAGAGGLSVAAGAAQMGAKTILIESDKMGGDCLNYGCVPSKALLAASQMATHINKASHFGIIAELLKIDFQQVHHHIQTTNASIAPHDSVERFEGLGVQVIKARAQFISPNTVKAGDFIIRARRFVIATGAKTHIPAIPGLRHVTYYTNETIFDITSAPQHLIIIGGGAMGIEMAQAYCRLGCQVTLLEADKILPQNDREVAAFIADKLRSEGVTILEAVHIIKIEEKNGALELNVEIDGNIHVISGSHLLLATGRKANFEPLDLDKANIRFSETEIETDQRLRTSNKKIFAIGDVIGAPQFTHAAGYQAGIVIRNALFRIPAKADYRIMPRVIYTEPELAELGLQAADIEAQGEEPRVLYHKFANNDRARTEQDMEGFIKITTTARGKILGVIIVGKNAGDLLAPWILALQQGLSIASMANMIAPYPTRSEIAKHAAGSFYTPTLFSKKTKHFVRFLSWFG